MRMLTTLIHMVPLVQSRLHGYLRSSGKPIAYNTSQYQPIKSILCGWYCVLYIRERAKGVSQYDVLAKLDINNPEKNDQFIKNYFSQHGGGR